MEYLISLPVFEGPFHLLFHLIKKAEVDIQEISIVELTDQFIEYVGKMEELDLDIATEFIVMAANLLKIKSRSLLPPRIKEDEDVGEEEFLRIDSEEELKERLFLYKKYQHASAFLKELESRKSKIFTRGSKGFDQTLLNKDVTTSSGQQQQIPNSVALENAMKKIVASLVNSTKEIPLEKYSVKIVMEEILTSLRVSKGMKLEFSKLFAANSSRIKVIITFFSILELIRMGKIKAWQDDNFDKIYIYLLN